MDSCGFEMAGGALWNERDVKLTLKERQVLNNHRKKEGGVFVERTELGGEKKMNKDLIL